jgi:hypothetical protein
VFGFGTVIGFSRKFAWMLGARTYHERNHLMTLECINPEDLPRPETYTQVVVAKGTRLVFVSGQDPEDVHGRLVGRGDLSIQARQLIGRYRYIVGCWNPLLLAAKRHRADRMLQNCIFRLRERE